MPTYIRVSKLSSAFGSRHERDKPTSTRKIGSVLAPGLTTTYTI
jgi:hypothetical protein